MNDASRTKTAAEVVDDRTLENVSAAETRRTAKNNNNAANKNKEQQQQETMRTQRTGSAWCSPFCLLGVVVLTLSCLQLQVSFTIQTPHSLPSSITTFPERGDHDLNLPSMRTQPPPHISRDSTPTVNSNVINTNSTGSGSRLRQKVGSWPSDIHNHTWIPPEGWRLFSREEIRLILSKNNIHFVGDSTARRLMRTMKMLLDPSVDETLFDSNILLDKVPEMNNCSSAYPFSACSLMQDLLQSNRQYNADESHSTLPVNTKILSMTLTYCIMDVLIFFEMHSPKETTTPPDPQTSASPYERHAGIIVVSIGPWEALKEKVCGRYNPTTNRNFNVTTEKEGSPKYNRDLLTFNIERVFHAMDEYTKRSNNVVIWKTSALPTMDSQIMRYVDNMMINLIENNQSKNKKLSFINFGTAIEPRSFGDARIDGGHVAHIAFPARNVAIQMLINQLADMGELVS